MSVPTVTMLIGGKTVEHRTFRCFLVIKVQRGIDPQAAFMNLVRAVLRFQIAPNFLDKIWRHEIRSALKVQTERS